MVVFFASSDQFKLNFTLYENRIEEFCKVAGMVSSKETASLWFVAQMLENSNECKDEKEGSDSPGPSNYLKKNWSLWGEWRERFQCRRRRWQRSTAWEGYFESVNALDYWWTQRPPQWNKSVEQISGLKKLQKLVTFSGSDVPQEKANGQYQSWRGAN